MLYMVITGVPDGDDRRGNLATAAGRVWLDRQAFGAEPGTAPRRLGTALGNPMLEAFVQLEVFALGEVLIVDASGREVTGLGRKPAKWDVQVEVFDDPRLAVERALDVLEARSAELLADR